MKITIDTRSDSKNEIRKAIKFLETFLDSQQDFPSGENVMGGLFENPPNVNPDSEPEESKDDKYKAELINKITLDKKENENENEEEE